MESNFRMYVNVILIFCFFNSVLGDFDYLNELPICESENQFIPHENCTLYYQCSNGEPILLSCAGELYFNPVTEGCDFQSNVPECVGGTRPPTGGTTSTPEYTPPPPSQSTQEGSSSTTESPENTSSTNPDPSPCPPDGIVQIPYPGNCSLYYLCVFGQGYIEECAEGLLFDPEIQKCNLAEEVECLESTPTTEATPPSTTEASPPSTTEASPPSTTEASPPPPTDTTTEAPIVTCPPEGIVFLPDPTDCTCKAYYICAEGTPLHTECADGLLFDAELGQCNNADEVVCDHCEVQPTCPDEDGISFIHVVGDCSKYIICVSGVGTELDCAEGTEFSPEAGTCVLDSAYECPYSKKTVSNTYHLGFLLFKH